MWTSAGKVTSRSVDRSLRFLVIHHVPLPVRWNVLGSGKCTARSNRFEDYSTFPRTGAIRNTGSTRCGIDEDRGNGEEWFRLVPLLRKALIGGVNGQVGRTGSVSAVKPLYVRFCKQNIYREFRPLRPYMAPASENRPHPHRKDECKSMGG